MWKTIKIQGPQNRFYLCKMIKLCMPLPVPADSFQVHDDGGGSFVIKESGDIYTTPPFNCSHVHDNSRPGMLSSLLRSILCVNFRFILIWNNF